MPLKVKFWRFYFDNGQDYKQAFHWFKKAAISGDAYAENMLGVLYFHGWGVKKSIDDACLWFFEATNSKYSSAIKNYKRHCN